MLAVVLGVAALTGCGDDRFVLAPVSGVVTFEGIPLSSARITFEPTGQRAGHLAGPGSFAITDGNGRFRLQTVMGEDGAVVGRHRVTIRAFRNSTDGLDMNIDNAESKEIVPAQYNDESTLTFEVVPDTENIATFELTSKPS